MKNRTGTTRPTLACALGLALVTAAPATADTIFLKNGALIDGQITHRTDHSIVLQIGDVGQVEIPREEIYLIEKNKRTGGEVLKSAVDTKSRVELVKQQERKDQSGAVLDRLPVADGDTGTMIDAPMIGEEEESIDPELKKRIERLVEDLDNQQRRYRVRAERHLKAIGRPSIPYLVPLAKSKRDLTRVAVMRLFYAFGDDRAIEPSVDALLDVNEYVRDYANKTLIRITGEDFGFVAQATPRRRELAQRKWKKWWETERKELEATRRAASSQLDTP